MRLVGDLNADPVVIPCHAWGIFAVWYVDITLSFSLRNGLTPDATCLVRRRGVVPVGRDFLVRCPNALASDAGFLIDWWVTPHFSVVARFCVDVWMVDVVCPILCHLVWPG